MSFILRGTLGALACDECRVPLEGSLLRLYQPVDDPSITARVAAPPRHTFHLLHLGNDAADGSVAATGRALLAEVPLGPTGAFGVELPDSYDGGALDVDLYCGTVAGTVPPHPHQLALTTIQPAWRTVAADTARSSGHLPPAPDSTATLDAGNAVAVATAPDLVAAFDYVIDSRLWCAATAEMGLWLISGTVTVCSTGQPVGGATVAAFDRDWLQDDPLGAAVTDAAGHFLLTYTAAQFARTPFSPLINVELVPGPDLYFTVSGPGGVTLLSEPPDTGRTPGRQNVGPCFCVGLCVPEVPPSTEPIPAFRYIGALDYTTDVDSGPGGTGRTRSDDRAFYSVLRLSGPIGTTLGGQPLEYRFEVLPPGAAVWEPVTPSQVAPTVIGTIETLVGTNLEVAEVVVNGTPSATVVAVPVAADGWIAMPQEGTLSTGLFTPNLTMIALDTPAVGTWTPVDVGAVWAGHALPSADLAADQVYGVRLRVRQAGAPATETSGGECQSLAIDNTLYNQVNRGGSWSHSVADGLLAVASVDIEELLTNGCLGIQNSLTVVVTAAHPNLGGVGLSMAGGGLTYGFALPAGTPGQIAGTAAHTWDVSTLPDCAYIITLSVEALLTTGDTTPLPVYDQVAFCKK